MSLRHLAAGSTQPPVNPHLLRLYSMKYCPYSHRTRLVLAHKKVPHDVVHVNLSEKPEWFLAKMPFGCTPVIEHEGNIIYESPICNSWLDDVYPEPRLTASTPNDRARDNIIMVHGDKLVSAFDEMVRIKNFDQAKLRLEKEFKFLEQSLQAKFFGGNEPGMVDFYVWPWFERLAVLEAHGYSGLSAETFPKLHQWVEDMMALPAVKQSFVDPAAHVKFFKSYLADIHSIVYDPED